MLVLHIIPAISPRYGGPTTNLFPLCQALGREGCEVEIASTDADGPGGQLQPGQIPADTQIRLFPRTWSESWKYSRPFAKWIDAHVGDYDLIHTHAVWSHLPCCGAMAAFRKKVPFVVRPAGMLSAYSMGRKSVAKKILWWMREGKMVRHASAFHATSSGEAEEIRRLRPDAEIWTIPHGLPDEAFSIPVETGWLRSQCPMAGNLPIVLFFSRIHPKKGLSDILIPAFSQMKNLAHLVIAGGEDSHVPGYENEVKRQILTLGLQNHVTFLGPIAPSNRWRLLDGAAAFALPSQAENFGVVVTEAMARGTPVVISDQVQIGDIVENNSGGRVIPRDVNLWARILSEVIGSPWDRYPRFRGTWDTAAKAVVQGYESILKAR